MKIERERLRREERLQHVKEMAEERARREEERVQREREIAEEGRRSEREAGEKAGKLMGMQMERLMKIFAEERSASAAKGATELSVKLVISSDL